MVVSDLSRYLFGGVCLQTGACHCRHNYAAAHSLSPFPLLLFPLHAQFPALRAVSPLRGGKSAAIEVDAVKLSSSGKGCREPTGVPRQGGDYPQGNGIPGVLRGKDVCVCVHEPKPESCKSNDALQFQDRSFLPFPLLTLLLWWVPGRQGCLSLLLHKGGGCDEVTEWQVPKS